MVTIVIDKDNVGLLGVGFLQQSTPEFILTLWADEDEFIVDGRQPVIYNNIIPHTVSPEPEVKYTLIVLRLLRVPLLSFWLRNYLSMWESMF